jgi:lipid-binding SYLF domain-containing protein
MKTINLILAISALLTLSMLSSRADERRDLETLKQQVPQVIAQFKTRDSTLTNFFDKSQGYAVFPRVSRGGFVFGGASGRGLVYEKSKLIGSATLSQGTFGAQVGGGVFSQVIFFENAESLAAFKQSQFAMSAQIGAVAAAEGVGQTARYRNGVAVFTMVQTGLMVEASVGGQRFSFTPLPETK